MTRRRILCGLLLGSVVLALGVGVLWIVDARRVTRARFEKVKKGMSREEVIRIVGGPPADYSSGRALDYRYDWKRQNWLCEEGLLLVAFDDAETATEVRGLDVVKSGPPPTLTQRMRRWLGL